MNLIDWSILTLILGSGILSVSNGFVRELFSLLSWTISLIIAIVFLDALSNQLTSLIPSYADLRITVALISLFFTSFILLEWLSYLILSSIGRTRLSISDRILAVLFGTGRGYIVITCIIILAGLTHLPTKTEWQQSILIRHFKSVGIELRRHLPDDIAAEFKFEPPPELF